MNTELLHVIERQLLEVVGILTLADCDDDNRYARGRLIGVIEGLRIIINPQEEEISNEAIR